MVIRATTSESATVVPANTHVVQFNTVAQLPMKLPGYLNFSTCKAQLVMLLNEHKLLRHLTGTKFALPTTIIQIDSTISKS